jgi:alpha-beta hydrolase superfamily lysophospholipase
MGWRGHRTGTRAVTGIACALFGLFACAVPFAAVGVAAVVLAVGLLLAAPAQLLGDAVPVASRRVLAAAYLVAAAAVGLWPAIPFPVASAITGIVLVAAGGVELWTALASSHRSWLALGGGAITLVSGAVATLWTDPVLMPIVVALGWRLVLVGSGLLVDVWYPPGLLGVRTGPRRTVLRVGALTAAVVITVAAAAVDPRGTVPGFYDIDIVAGTPAGALLRATETAGPDGTGAFRLLYATTGDDGTMRPASAVLSVPSTTRAAELPVVVWVHGTTGVARSCAPSLLGDASGGPADTSRLLAAGYAVLAVDLPGLGTSGPSSYLLGEAEGTAVLDGVRAVAQVPGVRVGPTVLWGYDQGGHAVLWAAQIASDYAPDISIAGVVAVAPMTGLTPLFAAAISSGRAGTLGTDLLLTYSARYTDVRLADYTSAGRALVDELGAHCGSSRGVVADTWAQASGFDQTWAMPASSALATRLAQNTPSGPFGGDVLVVQGAADTQVPAVVQDDWVQGRCSAGAEVEYRKLPGVDHAGVIRDGSAAVDGMLAWIGDRFAGGARAGLCGG